MFRLRLTPDSSLSHFPLIPNSSLIKSLLDKERTRDGQSRPTGTGPKTADLAHVQKELFIIKERQDNNFFHFLFSCILTAYRYL
jgi:hypothetical protein